MRVTFERNDRGMTLRAGSLIDTSNTTFIAKQDTNLMHSSRWSQPDKSSPKDILILSPFARASEGEWAPRTPASR